MALVQFNISENKDHVSKDAFAFLKPIPMIPDPDWQDPGDGSEVPMVRQFNKTQWRRRCIRGFIIKSIARYEHKVALDGVVYQEDESSVD